MYACAWHQEHKRHKRKKIHPGVNSESSLVKIVSCEKYQNAFRFTPQRLLDENRTIPQRHRSHTNCKMHHMWAVFLESSPHRWESALGYLHSFASSKLGK